MSEALIFIGIIVIWVILQMFILPRFGVQT